MIAQLGMPWHLPASTASASQQQALSHQICKKKLLYELKFICVQKIPIEIGRGVFIESFGIGFFLTDRFTGCV